MTDLTGDTVAIGNLNFFGQIGGTSQTYSASTTLDSIPSNFTGMVYFRYDTSVCALPFPCDTCSITPTVTGDVLLCPNESGMLTTQSYDSYQWYKRSFSGTAVPIQGATSQTLSIVSVVIDGYPSQTLSFFGVKLFANACHPW